MSREERATVRLKSKGGQREGKGKLIEGQFESCNGTSGRRMAWNSMVGRYTLGK
jgi:hypothetical protein